ncbi:MAG: hypothetical protein JWQ07_5070, partial [Ramlibacter sp.]|nr:hypothetical protein [Ramlibacter sp.]
RLLACSGSLLQFIDPATGDTLFDEALRIVEVLDDDRLRGFVQGEICFGFFGSMRSERGHDAGQIALPLLRSTGDTWGTTAALCFDHANLVHLGRFAEATELGKDTVRLCERIGNQLAVFGHERIRRAREFFQTGDLEALDALGRWDLDYATRMGWTPWTGHSYGWLGLARFLGGDWDSAAPLFERGASLAQAPSYGGFTWGARLHFLAVAGRRDEALAYLESMRGELPRPGQPNPLGAWAFLSGTVDALAVLLERDSAAAFYPLVLEARATGAVTASYLDGRLLERVAGSAAACGGQWDHAQRHFQTALAQADSLPHQVERLETRRSYAAMLTQRAAHGDADRARILLGEALAGYRHLRMPRHADLAAAALTSV